MLVRFKGMRLVVLKKRGIKNKYYIKINDIYKNNRNKLIIEDKLLLPAPYIFTVSVLFEIMISALRLHSY